MKSLSEGHLLNTRNFKFITIKEMIKENYFKKINRKIKQINHLNLLRTAWKEELQTLLSIIKVITVTVDKSNQISFMDITSILPRRCGAFQKFKREFMNLTKIKSKNWLNRKIIRIPIKLKRKKHKYIKHPRSNNKLWFLCKLLVYW